MWPVVNLGSPRSSEGRKKRKTAAKGMEVAEGDMSKAEEAFVVYLE